MSTPYTPIRTIEHIRNSFNMGFGRIVAQVINLIVIPIMLQFISPSDYGIFALYEILALILGVAISLGLPIVFMSEFNQSEDETKSKILFTRILLQQLIVGEPYLLLFIIFQLQLSELAMVVLISIYLIHF